MERQDALDGGVVDLAYITEEWLDEPNHQMARMVFDLFSTPEARAKTMQARPVIARDLLFLHVQCPSLRL